MTQLRISIAQIPVNDKDVLENIKTIEQAIDKAVEQKADILLTPEGSLSGYHNHFDPEQVAKALNRVTNRAKSVGLGLALGTCFNESDGKCYNELRFYDKTGEYLGCHTKTLLCGSVDEPVEGEINDFSVQPLRTFDFHGITIGGLICNDMWANPECTSQDDIHLAKKLKDMGAKIIFHAVNGGRDTSEFSQVVCRGYHESNLLMRARGYGVYIATVDNAYPCEYPNSCSAGIVTPKGEWDYKIDNTGLKQELCIVNID